MLIVDIDKASEKMLKESLKALHLLGDKPLEQIMREQGRLLAVDLLTWTHVIGNKPVIGKMQKAAIIRSIKRTYKSVDRVMGAVAKKAGRGAAGRFDKFIKSNDLASAQRMIDSMGLSISAAPWNGRPIKLMRFDGGAIHKRRRKAKEMAPPNINYVVVPYEDVEKFAKKESLKAGELKSGWAEAAVDLGKGMANPTAKIPAFARAKRHKTKGWGKTGGGIGKKDVTVANLSPYAIRETVDYQKAFQLRGRSMRKVLERMIRRNARDVTKAQRSRRKDLAIASKTIKNAMKHLV